MTQFENILLTQDEERLMTDIILGIIEKSTVISTPISNEDLFHELCKRAESYDKVKALNVDLRKRIMDAKKEIESGGRWQKEKGIWFLESIECLANIFDDTTAILYQKAKNAAGKPEQEQLESKHNGTLDDIEEEME